MEKGTEIQASDWTVLIDAVSELAKEKKLSLQHSTGDVSKTIAAGDHWVYPQKRIDADDLKDLVGAINQLEVKFSNNCCQANCCQSEGDKACQSCQSQSCQSHNCNCGNGCGYDFECRHDHRLSTDPDKLPHDGKKWDYSTRTTKDGTTVYKATEKKGHSYNKR